jgi:copper resistance protein C
LPKSLQRRTVLPGLILLGLPLLPEHAAAHAIPEDSQPAAGGSVVAGPASMRFRFNSRIDRARSRLTLIRPDRTHATLKIGTDGTPDILATQAELEPGAYTVRWQVLAIDGHITRGDVPFTVTGP